MVVALAIVAMAMALGMQALLQWSKAQERFAAAETRGRETLLTEEWVRTALRSRLSRTDRGDNGTPIDAFVGTPNSVSLVTLSPIAQRRGVATRQDWALVVTPSGHGLQVRNGAVLRLPIGEAPRFIYVNAEGEVHGRWPPRINEEGIFPTLVGIVTDSGSWVEASTLRPVTVPYEQPAE